jgi:hypothetical protein
MSDEVTTRALLAELFEEWQAAGTLASHVHGIGTTEDGELIPVFAGASDEGRGTFRCEVEVLEVAQTMLRDCRKVINEATFNLPVKDGTAKTINFIQTFTKSPPDEYAVAVAKIAMQVFLTNIRAKLCDLFDETYEDAVAVAHAIVLGEMGQKLADRYGVKVNVKPTDIEAQVEKAAAKRRAHVIGLMERAPFVQIPPKGKGRWEKLTKATLKAAIAKRRRRGETATAEDIADDLMVDESAVRKAAAKHGVEIESPE